ncbi:MAG: SsrA-binding protein SmpB [Deltaproteobacteria bacterium]|jgi:SsrA-binding protein|nr:SsrA-binding protein SmpB [Deltaproteobacteria bacterium]
MGVIVVANNKKAYHEYFIDEVFEAGLVLTGTEIKSIRLGQVSIKESYCRIRNGDIYVENMNISPYEQGNRENHDPTRIRKLLLHRDEINKLVKKVDEKGLSLIPTKIYLKGRRAKLEIGVGRGKKLYDKRETLKRKQADRESARAIREHSGKP